MEEQKEELTEEQAQELFKSMQEGKETSFGFFTKVVNEDDSSKIGNLDMEELGIPDLPVRTRQELAVFCEDVCGNKEWASYFNKIAEITLATSLSKEGFLLKQVGTSRKEVADMTPKKRINKGWFKKPNEGEQV